MKLVPGARLGPYEILGAVGAGGMGEVYRARDPRLGRDVALKVIAADQSDRPDRLRRFEQEARAVAALNHPHILAVFDVGSEKDTAYVVFELLEGQTLRERLDQAPIPVRKAVDYGVQLAEGLAAAHSRGVIHRDLKPSNVYLTRDGQIKILDFGLAKLRDPISGAESETNTSSESGAVVGTAGYMAPEQARGGRADARSDVFALGAVIYEMIAGRRAFDGATSTDRLSALLSRDPLKLESSAGEAVSPALERLIGRCLEKDVEQRFQTAKDVAFALEAQAGADTAQETKPAAYSWIRWVAGGVAISAMAAALVLLRARHPVEASLARFTQLTFGHGIVTGARFVADERTVVYSASWNGQPNEIFMTRLDGRESRSLGLPPAKLFSVSSKGELAIQLTKPGELGDPRLGTLARVPLVGGVPQQLLENVVDADWSPDGNDLAAVRLVDGEQRLEFPLGKELWRSTTAPYQHHCMRVSPHGDAVALITNVLLIVKRSGEQRSLKLPDDGQFAIGLAWAPSGDAVWVTTSPKGDGNSLWRFGLDGSQREAYRAPGHLFLHDLARSGAMLVHHGVERASVRAKARGASAESEVAVFGTSFATDISADGNQIVVYDNSDASTYLVPIQGQKATRLASGMAGRISPDGKRLLKWGNGLGDSALLVPIGPGDSRQLPLQGIDISDARFLDDGRIYWRGRAPGETSQRGFVQDLGTGEMKAATPIGVLPAWAPVIDGAVLGRQADGYLAWFPLAGGAPRVTRARLPMDILPFNTSADGKWAFVANSESVPLRVDRLELATGRREHWKTLGPPDLTGVAWIPGWAPMTSDGAAYAYTYLRVFQDLFLVEGVK